MQNAKTHWSRALRNPLMQFNSSPSEASWRSGHAEDCKSGRPSAISIAVLNVRAPCADYGSMAYGPFQNDKPACRRFRGNWLTLVAAGILLVAGAALPAQAGLLDDILAHFHRTLPTDPSGSGDPSHSGIEVSGPERFEPRDVFAEPICQMAAAAERGRAVIAAFAFGIFTPAFNAAVAAAHAAFAEALDACDPSRVS